MHMYLREYIDSEIDKASTFVLKYMPIALSVDQIYEGLVGEPHVYEAFAGAVKYMPPTSLNRRVDTTLNGTAVKLNLKFYPTEKYPMFLMPKYDLVIYSESELGKSLALAVKVAQDWEMLSRLWKRMAMHISDLNALQLLFPWLHEILRDKTWASLPSTPKMKREREEIDRNIRTILRGSVPNRFPRLTSNLNAVATSGRALFSQYRMLEATLNSDRWIQAPATIERLSITPPQWFEEHLSEVINDWSEEEMARMNIKLDGIEFVQRRRVA